jgi:hypothetical protein
MAKLSFRGVIKFGDIFKNQQKNILRLFHLFGCIFAPVNQKQQGVCQNCGLAIYIKKYFFPAKKKNYENSNISPCKNIIFQKNPLKETKDITTL